MPSLLSRLRRRLTFANVTSGLALFVALGGTSYAAISVGSAEIRTGAVGASEIRRDAVRASEIKTSSVGKGELRTGAVGKSEILTDAIGDAELLMDSVTSSELRDGTVEPTDLSSATRTAFTAARAAVTRTGTLAGGNAKTVDHTAASGIYTVEFDRDVSACTYAATPAAVKNGTVVEQPANTARVTVAQGDATSRITVKTYNTSAGVLHDEPFHVIAVC